MTFYKRTTAAKSSVVAIKGQRARLRLDKAPGREEKSVFLRVVVETVPSAPLALSEQQNAGAKEVIPFLHIFCNFFSGYNLCSNMQHFLSQGHTL